MSKKDFIKKYKGRYGWFGYLKKYLLMRTTKRKNETKFGTKKSDI